MSVVQEATLILIHVFLWIGNSLKILFYFELCVYAYVSVEVRAWDCRCPRELEVSDLELEL